jgi:hypothetical protein
MRPSQSDFEVEVTDMLGTDAQGRVVTGRPRLDEEPSSRSRTPATGSEVAALRETMDGVIEKVYELDVRVITLESANNGGEAALTLSRGEVVPEVAPKRLRPATDDSSTPAVRQADAGADLAAAFANSNPRTGFVVMPLSADEISVLTQLTGGLTGTAIPAVSAIDQRGGEVDGVERSLAGRPGRARRRPR